MRNPYQKMTDHIHPPEELNERVLAAARGKAAPEQHRSARRWGRAAVAAFTRWVVGQTACVIAPTQKVRRLLEGYHVAAPIAVIPTGIDLSRFSASADDKARQALRCCLRMQSSQAG